MAVKLPEVLNASTMSPVRILHPQKLSAVLSTLSVAFAETEILISEGVTLGDWVKIYFPNGKIAVYRCGNPSYNYDSGKEVVRLTHGCSTLADNIIPEGYAKDSEGKSEDTYFSGTPKSVIEKILTYQKVKHWKVGNVEATESVKVAVEYPDILTLLNDVMDQLPGYYIDYDQTSYPWSVNVLKIPTTVTAEGRLSRNVKTAEVSYDDSDLCTRLYCNSLPNKYIDSGNISKYGIREQFLYIADNTDSEWVTKACNIYLKNREKPEVSVSIDGADFSKLTGVSLDKVVLGSLYRLAVPKYNVTVEEQVTELQYSDLLLNQYNVKIMLGEHRKDLSSALAQTASTATSAHHGASSAQNAVGDTWSHFSGVADGLNTLIDQTGNMIRLEANDMIQQLHAELTITASEIRSEVTKNRGDVYSLISQMAESIRMEVQNTANGLGSSITQTATSIVSEVHNSHHDLQTQISQNATDITLRVKEGDVATELVVEMGNVSIKNGNLVVDGMVTADAVKTAIAKIDHLQVYGTITAYTIKIKAGSTEKNVWSAIEDLKYDRTVGNTVYLRYTKFNGVEGEVSFSKAALLKGTWSGGTYTAGPNASGSSTIVATQLHNNPYKLTYWPLLNTYTVEVGYMQGGMLKSTGGNLSFIAEDAYKAGQDSVQIPHPTYSGSWDGGTYVVKADGVSVQSTSLGSVEIPEEGSEDIRWIGTTKWLSVPVVIKDTLTHDTGYHPQLNIPAGKAYNEGWKGYHDSNKFSMDVGANANIKNVYRPGATPSASAETWFKLRVQAAWATQPGTTNITDTNTVTWSAQRRLTGSNDWVNMVSVPSTLTLFQSGGFVYARVGAQNVAKVSFVPSISVSGWAFIAGYQLEEGLKKTSESKARFSVKATVNGTDYSSVITTNYKFKLTSLISDKKYLVLNYGQTALAWLKKPDPVATDWKIGDAFVEDQSTGLVKVSSAKLRFAVSMKADAVSQSEIVTTSKKFSLTKLIGDDEYAGLTYGSDIVAWLKMPDRQASEPTVNGFFANYGYQPSGGLEPADSSKMRFNVGVSVNGVQHSAIVTTANAFSLGSNVRTGYLTLYYGSTPVAWLKTP